MGKLERAVRVKLLAWGKSHQVYKTGDSIFLSKRDFCDAFPGAQQDLVDMALTSLCHQKFSRMVSVHGCPYIKLDGVTNTCDPVNDTETSVLLLIHTNSDLEKQINEAQTSENEVSAQVKSFLKTGRRQAAKTSLKRLKRTQRDTENKMEVCDKLDSILMSIEGATDQAKVLEAFKHGLKALEAAN